MKSFLSLAALCWLAVCLIGCGGAGGLNQADMIAAARSCAEAQKNLAAQTPAAAPTTAPPADSTASTTPANAEPAKDPSSDSDPGDAPSDSATDSRPQRSQQTEEETPQSSPPSTADTAAPVPDELAELATPEQVAARAKWNMERIAEAFSSYSEKRNAFPPLYHASLKGPPLLSWRVMLLPDLGYESLFQEFKLDEPWNSAHNKKLVAKIPPVYDLALKDGKTPFLGVQYADGVLRGRLPVSVVDVTDGLDRTLLAAHCGEDYSVVWTQPLELDIDKFDPLQSMSPARWVAFADGTVKKLRDGMSERTFRALVTIDSGEKLTAADFASADERPGRPSAANPGQNATPQPNSPQPQVPPSPGGDLHGVASAYDYGKDEEGPNRTNLPLGTITPPMEEQLAAARERFRTIFEKDYLEAKTPTQRSALAGLMLQKSESLQPGTPDHYVLLDLTASIAAVAGDFDTAEKAVETLRATFDIDLAKHFAKVLDAYVKSPNKRNPQAAYQRSLDLIPQAVEKDEYETAETLRKFAAALAGRRPATDIRDELDQQRKAIEVRSAHYQRVKTALAKLETEPESRRRQSSRRRLAVPVQGPMAIQSAVLAKSASPKLAELGRLETNETVDPVEQWALAEKWWAFAADNDRYQNEALRRAVHWYRTALPGLNGLERLKAEFRLKEVGSREWGIGGRE